MSAKIEVEPEDIILSEGPIIGQLQQERLSVIASGWPAPSFQWYRNNLPIAGANSSDFILNILCKQSDQVRQESSCHQDRIYTILMHISLYDSIDANLSMHEM